MTDSPIADHRTQAGRRRRDPAGRRDRHRARAPRREDARRSVVRGGDPLARRSAAHHPRGLRARRGLGDHRQHLCLEPADAGAGRPCRQGPNSSTAARSRSHWRRATGPPDGDAVVVAGSMSHMLPMRHAPEAAPSPARAAECFSEMAEILAAAGVDLIIMEMMSNPISRAPRSPPPLLPGCPCGSATARYAGRTVSRCRSSARTSASPS